MKNTQRQVDLTDGGLIYVRLGALFTMFFLGAAAGRAITAVPWWASFTLAVIVGFYMVLSFLKACDGIEAKARKEQDHEGA